MTTPQGIERLSAALAAEYSIGDELGRGGMAVVYRAHDVRHDRGVAVKVLKAEVGEDVGAERFLREIRVAAGLQHPHILPVYDSGTADGLLYYVMPLAEGPSVRERVKSDGQLPLEEVMRITEGVAGALDYAHRRGVIHRDIKPENILLQEGEALVADFGVAKAIGPRAAPDLTQAGLLVGTPAYMSPEQAAGETDLDGRCDQYCLGAVVYEMLTGAPLFTGDNVMEVLSKRFTDEIPRPARLRGDLPAGVEKAVMKALAFQPADRYETVAEFADAIASGMRSGRRARVSSADAAPSLGVLPFTNLSADPENEYFSDGIAEEILSVLARLTGLRVAARTSAFAFKGRTEDVREIGRKLNVAHVLEGSVRKAGNRVRVTARLTSVSDGYQVWTRTFDRELEDVFAIQDDIARSIVEILQVTLFGDESRAIDERKAPKREAHELYLKGRYHWNKRTEPALRKSVQFFERAIEEDPEYALAHAGLADAYAILGIYGFGRPDDVMPKAREAAERALAANPSLAEAHTSRGCVRSAYSHEWAAAEDDFRRAVELSPRYATSRQWYAMNCLIPLGRFEEAERELTLAQELDPLSLAIGVSVGLRHYFARRYDDAVSAYTAALETDPDFPIAHFFLGQAHVELGRYGESIRALERAVELDVDSTEMRSSLGHAYAKAGRRDEAEAVIGHLAAESQRRYVSPALLGQVHMGLGNTGAALDCLERAMEVHSLDLMWLAVRPVWDPLRSEERFAALLGLLDLTGR